MGVLVMVAISVTLGWKIQPLSRALRLTAIVNALLFASLLVFVFVADLPDGPDMASEDVGYFLVWSAFWTGVALLMTWATHALRSRRARSLSRSPSN